jgi:iron complex outermembrane recepter protein
VTYNLARLTTTLQVRWIGRGSYEAITAFGGAPVTPGEAGYSTTNPNSINTNSVASAYYVNLFGSYNVTDNVSLFASIDNLLNRSPPVAPGGNGYPTNPVYFDTYGMFWRFGVRVRF